MTKKLGFISKIILNKAKAKRNAHSVLDNLQPVLIKIKVTHNVRNNIKTEKILSLSNILHQVEHSATNKHLEVNSNGATIELIPITHKILNISDQITFHTHISYLFLIMAITVAATSGKLVPAATIVAPIAHSETPKYWAIKIAATTIWSEAKTNNHKLAKSFAKFIIFHFQFLWISGISFLKYAIISKINNIQIKTNEYIDSPKLIENVESMLVLLKIERATTKRNIYMKFLNFGGETSTSSSWGASFLIQR